MRAGDLPLLSLSNLQAEKLAGKSWKVDDKLYRFKEIDPRQPGVMPWQTGSEGRAYPLLGEDRRPAAFLKTFLHPTQYRVARTAWLIGQRLHEWLPQLAGAPYRWVDSRQMPSPAGIDFPFNGFLTQAVPGLNWIDLKKTLIENDNNLFDESHRWRAVNNLIQAVAVLEQSQICHGDLSENNVLIDLTAPKNRPMLYLIDFDAFVCERLGSKLAAVPISDRGTFGTLGYCPPDLLTRSDAGDMTVVPYSDRFGRDMLILELLLACPRVGPSEGPIECWKQDRLRKHFDATYKRVATNRSQMMEHLHPPAVFTLSEAQRPSSVDLARILNLKLPPRVPDRPKVSIWNPPATKPTVSPSIPTGPNNMVTGKKKRGKKRRRKKKAATLMPIGAPTTKLPLVTQSPQSRAQGNTTHHRPSVPPQPPNVTNSWISSASQWTDDPVGWAWALGLILVALLFGMALNAILSSDLAPDHYPRGESQPEAGSSARID